MTSDDTRRPGSLRDILSAVQRLSEAQSDQTLIMAFIQEALEVPPDEDEAARIEESRGIVNEVIQDVKILLDAIDDPEFRIEIKILSIVNDALLHGFILGSYSVPTAATHRMREDEVRGKLTAPATKARKESGNRIQRLVENLAFQLWSKKSSFKENPTGTAKEIQGAFNQEIRTWKLEDITPGWLPADLEDPIAKKKEVERLRKRIVRVLNEESADNRRSSS